MKCGDQRDDLAAFKKRVIDSNREAFELFSDTASLIEGSIEKARDISEPFARALDLLFIQAYKSFTALYILGVHGHGEDAATILRRLLEISLQVSFLTADANEPENRGERCLAYYWARVPDVLKRSLPAETRRHLEDLFNQHKHPLSFNKRGNIENWWGGIRPQHGNT